MDVIPSIYDWISSNLIISETKYLFVGEISKAYKQNTGIDINYSQLSRHLKTLFNLPVAKRKNNPHTGNKDVVYNLAFKDIDMTVISPMTLILPEYCSVLQRSADSLTFTIPTSVIICNVNVIKEIYLESTTWHMSVLNKKIFPSVLGCNPENNWTATRIHSIFQIAANAKICIGKLIPDDCDVLGRSVKEEYFIKGDENASPESRARSLSCSHLLPLSATGNICHPCNSIKLNKHTLKPDNSECKTSDNEMNVKLNEVADEHGHVELNNEDSTDLQKVLSMLLSLDIPDKTKTLFTSQLKNLNCTPTQRRWDPDIISTCLALYCRSPKAYEELCDGGMIVLPSGRLLRYYKNVCDQSPGFQDSVLSWMRAEAKRLNVPTEGWFGGLLIDEMTIQQDLQIVKRNSNMTLVGNVDIGELGNLMDRITDGGKHKLELAKSVLQFVFVGHTGFRFPIGHFPVKCAQAQHLYFNFWDAVSKLEEYGFYTDYVSLDGAVSNRQFLKLHFHSTDPVTEKYIAKSPINPNDTVIFLMDIKHNLKKIRNGISKSDGKAKNLKLEGKNIRWSFFKEAFVFSNDHIWKIHRRLTEEHFELNGPLKMRNKLAEDVLDKEMLYLFQELKKSKAETKDFHNYDGVIEMLKITSKLVEFAHDRRPLDLANDKQIDMLKDALQFFVNWDNNKDNSSKLSRECMEDMFSYLHGMIELHNKASKRGHSVIVPARINSDPVENIFCQQRGIRNGLSTNPTYAAYGPATNAIILTQTAISKKSNTGGQCATLPYKFHHPENNPLKKKYKPIRI